MTGRPTSPVPLRPRLLSAFALVLLAVSSFADDRAPSRLGARPGRPRAEAERKTWVRRYRANDSYSLEALTRTPDGGLVLAGRAVFPGSPSFVKVDSAGSIVWSRTFAGLDQFKVRSVRPAPDGGLLAALWQDEIWDDRRLLVLKLGFDGAREWSFACAAGSEWCLNDVRPARDGGALVAGRIKSGGSWDALVAKLSRTGAPSWSRRFGLPDRDEAAEALLETTDGRVLVVSGALLFELGPAGDWHWGRGEFLWAPVAIRAFEPRRDGGAVAAGWLPESGEAIVVEYSAAGTIRWRRRFSLANTKAGFTSVRETAGGDLLLAGFSRGPLADSGADPTGTDILLTRLGPAGEPRWQRTLAVRAGYLDPAFVEPADEEGCYVGGSTREPRYQEWPSFLLAKTASDGTIERMPGFSSPATLVPQELPPVLHTEAPPSAAVSLTAGAAEFVPESRAWSSRLLFAPPVDLVVRGFEDRSLASTEHVLELRWSRNPLNLDLGPVTYRLSYVFDRDRRGTIDLAQPFVRLYGAFGTFRVYEVTAAGDVSLPLAY